MQDELKYADREKALVVFGGAGFIGTHLMETLKRRGYRRIISIDIKEPKRPVAGIDYHTHDVRALDMLDFGVEVPALFNLAAVHTTPGHHPWEYYNTNVAGATAVTRFALRHQTRSIHFTSSISVYGPDETAKDEKAPPTPASDYGRSKYMAEQIHRDWLAGNADRKLVISRPAVVFGLGEGGNFTRLARMLRKGFFVYPGRKDTIKSCIYVGDLVNWILEAGRRDESFILFNGAFSDRYTIEQIVETFREVAYPNARSLLVSAVALKIAAAALRPLSSAGLGIHPDRIKKLMVSTNILPGWAEQAGLVTGDRLRIGLETWKSAGQGEFI